MFFCLRVNIIHFFFVTVLIRVDLVSAINNTLVRFNYMILTLSISNASRQPSRGGNNGIETSSNLPVWIVGN